VILSRTILSAKRDKNTINTNLGRIIIFCEGNTEKFYFEYFKNIIEKNKFNDIRIELETSDGNASRVLKFAEQYISDEKNLRKYSNYKKYLVFDCDAPPNIQRVITNMLASDNNYELLVSNHLFETWLLMHFENVDKKISKNEIYRRLSNHLSNEYKKANEGVIREIILKGNLEEAMKNAERLAEKYKAENADISSSINKMNPYTNVNEFVEQLLAAIT